MYGSKGQDAHIEGVGANGDFAADAAQADETNGFAAHFGAGGRLFPLPFAHGGVKFWDLADEREQKREGVFGNADGASARAYS